MTIFRAKKVHDGVTHAAKLFPNAYIVMIAIGAIKGNGAGFVKVDLSSFYLFSDFCRSLINFLFLQDW